MVPSILVFIFYGLGFIPLIKAVEKIDLSIVYAIWSGLGIVVVSIIGFLFFKETVNFIKIVCIVLVIIGVVGLRWVVFPMVFQTEDIAVLIRESQG